MELGLCKITLSLGLLFLFDNLFTLAHGDQVRFFDLNGQLQHTLSCVADVKEAKFFPDSPILVIQTKGNRSQLWNIEQQSPTGLSHDEAILSVNFDVAGGRIITCSRDDLVNIWKLNGQLLSALDTGADVLAADMSVKGGLILTTSTEGMIKLWDIAGDLLLDQNLNSRDSIPAVFSSDGQYIILVYDNNTSLRVFLSPEMAESQTREQREQFKSQKRLLEQQYNIGLETNTKCKCKPIRPRSAYAGLS